MRLNRLFLEHYRNYQTLQLSLDQVQQVAIVGNNAQGKSNLLEALYVLAFTSSFRTSKLTELIQWEYKVGRCAGDFEGKFGDIGLQFSIQSSGKRHVQVNHQFVKKLSEYIGHVHLVLFSSKDLQMVHGSPHYRRMFLNLLLVQIFPRYYEELQKYNKILKKRNRILKSLQKQNTKTDLQLDVWDQQLAMCAAYIYEKRVFILDQLNQEIKKVHSQISGFNEVLLLNYEPSMTLKQQESKEELAQRIQAEWLQKRHLHVQRGQTLSGPHRDDFEFILNSRMLKSYGSQGQIRTSILSLKIAELTYLTQFHQEPPILLLDDVFSELDLKRQQALIQYIKQPGIQTFLTTTHLEPIIESVLGEHSLVLHVSEGTLHCEKNT